MADVKSMANPLFLREEELRQGIEMLFFAYRDFTGSRTPSWRRLISGGPTIGSSILSAQSKNHRDRLAEDPQDNQTESVARSWSACQ